MWTLRTKKVVIRDQFRVLPIPDIVIAHLDQLATADGYSRGSDPSLENPLPPDIEDDIEDDIADAIQKLPALPDMMPIDGRADAAAVLPVPAEPETTVGVIEQQQLPLEYEYVLRRSERITAAINTEKS
jgi:hypothetical protein